jgi:hypothetical protein
MGLHWYGEVRDNIGGWYKVCWDANTDSGKLILKEAWHETEKSKRPRLYDAIGITLENDLFWQLKGDISVARITTDVSKTERTIYLGSSSLTKQDEALTLFIFGDARLMPILDFDVRITNLTDFMQHEKNEAVRGGRSEDVMPGINLAEPFIALGSFSGWLDYNDRKITPHIGIKDEIFDSIFQDCRARRVDALSFHTKFVSGYTAGKSWFLRDKQTSYAAFESISIDTKVISA